jgi:FkbM family methyltransferase
VHLLRKTITALHVIRACENWPALLRTRLGPTAQREVRLRSGLRIQMERPLHEVWGLVFEAAIADVYGITRCDADVIVDVGANAGAFTCLAATTHPHARMHAFEPGAVRRCLLANLALNQLSHVTVHPEPVTGDGREVDFAEVDQGGSSGLFLRDGTPPERRNSVTLATVDFQNASSAFLKLDCEGAEGEIIAWVAAHLDTLPARVVLVCEYHPWCPVPLAASVACLAAAGFRCSTPVQFDEQYLRAERG